VYVDGRLPEIGSLYRIVALQNQTPETEFENVGTDTYKEVRKMVREAT
jgi:hypothetical protein